jgi:hypothetical protein
MPSKTRNECQHPKVTWKGEMVQTPYAIFNVGTCDTCHAEVEQEFGPKALRLRTVRGGVVPKHVELLLQAAAGLRESGRFAESIKGEGSLKALQVRQRCDSKADEIITYLMTEGYKEAVEQADV